MSRRCCPSSSIIRGISPRLLVAARATLVYYPVVLVRPPWPMRQLQRVTALPAQAQARQRPHKPAQRSLALTGCHHRQRRRAWACSTVFSGATARSSSRRAAPQYHQPHTAPCSHPQPPQRHVQAAYAVRTGHSGPNSRITSRQSRATMPSPFLPVCLPARPAPTGATGTTLFLPAG